MSRCDQENMKIEPFRFLDLPTEIQLKIIREYLPALIVPEHIAPASVFSLGEQVAIDNLSESCDKIRVLVRSIRTLAGKSEDILFKLDPERDTLLVWDMCLPVWIPLSLFDGHLIPPIELCLDPDALPIRRLLTVFQYVMEPVQIHTTDEHRGITADTGIEWKFRTSGLRKDWNEISQPRDLRKNTSNRNCTDFKPRIGLYGFSRGSMSQGGHWAGFRYYTDTEEVYFSPLAWSEVKHIVHRLSAPQGSARVLPGNQDPQLIARLWIVRPGEKSLPTQPHHCWLQVNEWRAGDPEWVAELMTM
ncbi:hypothetical protein ACHAPU_004894 [Fusarium lateritium]